MEQPPDVPLGEAPVEDDWSLEEADEILGELLQFSERSARQPQSPPRDALLLISPPSSPRPVGPVVLDRVRGVLGDPGSPAQFSLQSPPAQGESSQGKLSDEEYEALFDKLGLNLAVMPLDLSPQGDPASLPQPVAALREINIDAASVENLYGSPNIPMHSGEGLLEEQQQTRSPDSIYLEGIDLDNVNPEFSSLLGSMPHDALMRIPLPPPGETPRAYAPTINPAVLWSTTAPFRTPAAAMRPPVLHLMPQAVPASSYDAEGPGSEGRAAPKKRKKKKKDAPRPGESSEDAATEGAEDEVPYFCITPLVRFGHRRLEAGTGEQRKYLFDFNRPHESLEGYMFRLAGWVRAERIRIERLYSAPERPPIRSLLVWLAWGREARVHLLAYRDRILRLPPGEALEWDLSAEDLAPCSLKFNLGAPGDRSDNLYNFYFYLLGIRGAKPSGCSIASLMTNCISGNTKTLAQVVYGLLENSDFFMAVPDADGVRYRALTKAEVTGTGENSRRRKALMKIITGNICPLARSLDADLRETFGLLNRCAFDADPEQRRRLGVRIEPIDRVAVHTFPRDAEGLLVGDAYTTEWRLINRDPNRPPTTSDFIGLRLPEDEWRAIRDHQPSEAKKLRGKRGLLAKAAGALSSAGSSSPPPPPPRTAEEEAAQRHLQAAETEEYETEDEEGRGQGRVSKQAKRADPVPQSIYDIPELAAPRPDPQPMVQQQVIENLYEMVVLNPPPASELVIVSPQPSDLSAAITEAEVQFFDEYITGVKANISPRDSIQRPWLVPLFLSWARLLAIFDSLSRSLNPEGTLAAAKGDRYQQWVTEAFGGNLNAALQMFRDHSATEKIYRAAYIVHLIYGRRPRFFGTQRAVSHLPLHRLFPSWTTQYLVYSNRCLSHVSVDAETSRVVNADSLATRLCIAPVPWVLTLAIGMNTEGRATSLVARCPAATYDALFGDNSPHPLIVELQSSVKSLDAFIPAQKNSLRVQMLPSVNGHERVSTSVYPQNMDRLYLLVEMYNGNIEKVSLNGTGALWPGVDALVATRLVRFDVGSDPTVTSVYHLLETSGPTARPAPQYVGAPPAPFYLSPQSSVSSLEFRADAGLARISLPSTFPADLRSPHGANLSGTVVLVPRNGRSVVEYLPAPLEAAFPSGSILVSEVNSDAFPIERPVSTSDIPELRSAADRLGHQMLMHIIVGLSSSEGMPSYVRFAFYRASTVNNSYELVQQIPRPAAAFIRSVLVLGAPKDASGRRSIYGDLRVFRFSQEAQARGSPLSGQLLGLRSPLTRVTSQEYLRDVVLLSTSAQSTYHEASLQMIPKTVPSKAAVEQPAGCDICGSKSLKNAYFAQDRGRVACSDACKDALLSREISSM